MMTKKILIVDNVHPIILESLSLDGFSIIDGTSFDKNKILSIVSDFCGLVIRSRILIDKEIIITKVITKTINNINNTEGVKLSQNAKILSALINPSYQILPSENIQQP